MIKITDPSQCCGCTACASICAHDALTMKADDLGFLYPEVDLSRCTECGLCERVCAFNDRYDTGDNLAEPLAFGARHKDPAEVATSRSGGAFIALSDHILAQGGVVYGAGYGEHFRIMHKRATTEAERDEFKGSKYVQSDLRGIFRQVRQDLRQGLTVMFSGTPCQTAGLKSFVGRKLRDRLVLVDIVCHGVPSPKIWDDYLTYVEQQNGARVVSVNFRDKSRRGWAAHYETFKFDNGTQAETSKFRDIFYMHIMLRPSCHNCHYTNLRRPSDITLADYWGWEKTNPEFNKDDKGVSLLLINTPKGHELFEQVRSHLSCFEAKVQDCLQPQLQHPTTPHPKRDKFLHDYRSNGIEFVLNYDYNRKPLLKRAADKARRGARKILRLLSHNDK